MSRFLASGASGSTVWLRFIEFRGACAYMTTAGAGAYLVDPVDGSCEGVEGTAGCHLMLVANAQKRLRAIAPRSA